MIGYTLAVGGGAFALAVMVEQLWLGQMPPRPPVAAFLLRIGLFTWLDLAWLALWGEPGRAAFGAVATIFVMAGLSWGKRGILGEPLAFSDFGLIPLIIRFPRLYFLEGLRWWAFWATVAACFVIVAATQPAEPVFGPWTRVFIIAGSLVLVLGLPRLAGLRAIADILRSWVPEPRPELAIARWGLLPTLFVYWLRWAGDVTRPAAEEPGAGDGRHGVVGLDLVVIVQLESFLDPVRARLASARLPELERARSIALAHGPLTVPAYGAFTMRTEHAVLTGLSDRDIGFRRLDPYLTARGPAPPSIALRLAGRGWRTVFMHPFAGHFFQRHRIMPWLGFQDLQFEDRFADCRTVGPYIADGDFAERVVQEAGRADLPTLIMAVTMENHGPFSPHRGIPPTEDREQHLFHLQNTDAAIGTLIDGLSALRKRSLLCLYGDHPPILKAFPPGGPPETDYVVLLLGESSSSARETLPEVRSADALGRFLMRLCGVTRVTPEAVGTSA